MIYGVQSCRNGTGYCLLGLDCTLDDDFIADDTDGHCNGLKNAFTPVAHFTCCQVTQVAPTKRTRPPMKSTTPIPDVSNSSLVTFTESFENSTFRLDTVNTTELEMTSEETTTMKLWTESDVFIDLNNEVFKEVTPPVLDEQLIQT